MCWEKKKHHGYILKNEKWKRLIVCHIQIAADNTYD